MHNADTAVCFLQSSLQVASAAAGTVDSAVATSATSWGLSPLIVFIATLLVISIFASIPLVDLYFAKKRSICRIARLIFFYVWVFGGAFPFCYVLSFESSHFSETRHLNFSEAVYVMSQVLSTVGYGDISPVRRDRPFMAIYVFLSTVLVGDYLLSFLETALSRFQGGLLESIITALRGRAYTNPSEPHHRDSTPWWLFHKPRLAKRAEDVLVAFCVFAGMCLLWSLVYVKVLPGEQSSWSDSLYFAVITFTTVGFGDITVNTRLGQALACPLMLFGVASMAYFVYTFGRLMVTLEKNETWSEEEERGHLISNIDHAREEFEQEDDDHISQAEFLVLSLLQAGIISKEHLTRVNDVYRDLKSPDTGMVSKKQLLIGHSDLALPTKSNWTGQRG